MSITVNVQRPPDSVEKRFPSPSQRMAHDIYSFMKVRGFAEQEVDYDTSEGHEIAQISRVINRKGDNVVQIDLSRPRENSTHWVLQINRTKKKYEITYCAVHEGATQTTINERQHRPNILQALDILIDLRNVSRAIKN